MERYKIPVEDWVKVDLINASFILNEAKEYIDYLAADSDRITERAFSIIKILFPTVVVLVGLLVRSLQEYQSNWIKLMLCLSVIVGLYLLYQYYKLTFPRGYMSSGRDPKELEAPSFYGVDPDSSIEELRIALCLNEIENSAVKIEFNENQNLFRSEKLTENMEITWWAVVILITITLLGLWVLPWFLALVSMVV